MLRLRWHRPPWRFRPALHRPYRPEPACWRLSRLRGQSRLRWLPIPQENPNLRPSPSVMWKSTSPSSARLHPDGWMQRMGPPLAPERLPLRQRPDSRFLQLQPWCLPRCRSKPRGPVRLHHHRPEPLPRQVSRRPTKRWLRPNRASPSRLLR